MTPDMMEQIVVKLQFDLSGSSLMVSEVCGGHLYTLVGDEARSVAANYGLTPLTKTYADAEIDGTGLLHLGLEIDEP